MSQNHFLNMKCHSLSIDHFVYKYEPLNQWWIFCKNNLFVSLNPPPPPPRKEVAQPVYNLFIFLLVHIDWKPDETAANKENFVIAIQGSIFQKIDYVNMYVIFIISQKYIEKWEDLPWSILTCKCKIVRLL